MAWSPKLQLEVTFSHIPLFREWTEDIIRRCKTTLMKTDLVDAVYASMFLYKCNSPLMQRLYGEASISLWDLRILGGLPIYGAFYDEVVPTAIELEGYNDGKQFLPPSCKCMFATLQSITSTSGRSHVTFEECCRFYNKHEALTFLNVPEENCQSTYLVAFLSCWLCAFVLPLKNLGCIRPGVIYHGLNELSRSSTPGRSCNNFSAHYVYAWTAQYFRSHCMSVHNFAGAQMLAFHGASNGTINEAKAFIRSGQDINWIGNCMRNTRDRLLIDDSTLRQDADFLPSIRSCFRSLRYDNGHNILGALKPHLEEPSLQYLWSLFQTSTRAGTKSSFIIPASGMNNEIRSRTTALFKLWWKTSYSSLRPSPSPPQVSSSRKRKADNDNDTKADSSDKGKSKLQKSSSQSSREPSPQQEKKGTVFHDIFCEDEATLREKQKNDQDEDDFDFVKELETMGNAFASDNPNAKELEHTFASIDPSILVAASDPVAMYAAATVLARGSEVVNENRATSMEAPSFSARVMISEADRCAARLLAQQMRTKLLQTPLANIHELDAELKELFGYIISKRIDVTSLQEHMGNYVEHAQTFHASTPSDKAESSSPSLENKS
ncbi:Huntingtin-interacting protein 1-related protein [Bienertia sinuspersici]